MSLSLPLRVQKRRRQTKASSPHSNPSEPPADGLDRLTTLPDPLRLHVLSLLPLSSAIRTSPLSSHWKSLYKTCHPGRAPSNIALDVPCGCSPAPYLLQLSENLADPTRIFHSLRLSLRIRHFDMPRLHDVLRSAASNGVGDLSLDLRNTGTCLRRSSTCLDLSANFGSLVRLSLSGCRLLSSPPYFRKLGNLEYLNLYGVNLPEAYFRRIVSNLPLLRSLDVRRCPDLKKVVVAGPRIANVTVVECSNVSEIVVKGGILKKFHFKGEFAKAYSLRGVEHLENFYMFSNGPRNEAPVSNWVEAVGNLRSVKVLTLCSISLQHITSADDNVIGEFQYFQCLKELQLLMFSLTKENLANLCKFFSSRRCPSLERLFIELPKDVQEPLLETLPEVPATVFANLKLIKINGLKGHEYEMWLARFFLSNSRNLETLLVVAFQAHNHEVSKRVAWSDRSHKFQYLRTQFDVLPKSSANAKITVTEIDDFHVHASHEVYCKV